MNTITSSAGPILTPLEVLGYEAERVGGAIVHDIIGRADPDYTLRVAATRSGTLALLFGTDEDASLAAAVALAAAATFVLDSTQRTSIGMRFVVPDGGRIRRTLDPDTREVWTVEVDYREVAP